MTRFSSRLPVLLVALAVVCSVAAVAVPAGAADVQSAERTIQDTELQPGETTTVTVEVEQTVAENITILEAVEPAPGSITVTDTDPIGIQAVRGNEIVAAWENEQSVMVEYEVTIPQDAQPGDTYTITNNNEQFDVSGDDQIQVAENDSGGDDGGDDGSDDDGSDDGSDDGGSDDGSNDDGSDDDGSDDGSTDDGSDDGTSDDGTTDDGTSDDGTTDDGTSDDGTDDGNTTDGSTDDDGNTTDDGTTTGDDSTDDSNTSDDGSDDGGDGEDDTSSTNQQDDSEDDDSQEDDSTSTGDDDADSQDGDGDGSGEGDSIPGFGVLTAIGALLAGGALARRRA